MFRLVSTPSRNAAAISVFTFSRAGGCLRLCGLPTGDQAQALPNTLNIAIPGLDSEALMLALKDVLASSNGSACTSQNYTASHVLTAMGLPEDHIKGALRLSWCHLTLDVPWGEVVERIRGLR